VAARAPAAIRAIYRLLVSLVVRLEPHVGRSLLPLPPPYAYVQRDTLANLHAYLHVSREQIRRIVVVGAWHGEEVDEILELLPACRLVLLEPSRDAFQVLHDRLGCWDRVTCRQVAASDREGHATFHEMSVTGNGSLLPLATGRDAALIDGMREVDTYEVPTVRLDGLAELADQDPIDCLWVDVQGFEREVVDGAQALMPRVCSVFIEVATGAVTYEGATTFREIAERMDRHGFRLASLGTDHVNGQGNALWVRT
jgi:FkbM family methyltransferase